MFSRITKISLFRVVGMLAAAVILAVAANAQKISSLERSRAKDMLKTVKAEIKDKYFDTGYKGIDLDGVFKAASEKLDAATSLGQAFGIIGQAVLSLNDSHTTFYPPPRDLRVEYGWRMQMIGDACFVTAVKPKSDAEKQGLKPGDQILKVEGFEPNRKEMWKVEYYYNVISPRAGLTLTVRSPGSETPRDLRIASKQIRSRANITVEEYFREIELGADRKIENRFVRVGGTTAWHMPTFSMDPTNVENIMAERGRQSPNLIIDLRGNGGGLIATLETLAGYFVEADTKIADYKARKEIKPQMAKIKGKIQHRGRLVVLIDSHSGSASELFARFIQINEKGVVLGDQSAGAVMMSRFSSLSMGTDSIVLYGMNMTHADVIMTDGKSLEHVGVTPNVRLIPSGLSLSKGHDPVLSEAFKLLGEDVSPEQAGKFFPFNWKNEE